VIYTHRQLAEILDQPEEVIVSLFLEPPGGGGVPHRKVGDDYLIDGREFNKWIREGTTQTTGEQPNGETHGQRGDAPLRDEGGQAGQ
jgi:hypothetical protein